MPDAKYIAGAVEIYLAAINAGDANAVLSLLSLNAVVEDPVGSDPVRGHHLRAFFERASGMGIVARQTGPIRIAGQEAAVPFTIDVTAARTRIDVIDVFRFDEQGKIASLRAFWGPSNVTRIA